MAAQTKSFNCPNCGAGVQVRAVGRSLSVVCGSCGTIIDPNDPNFQILSKYGEFCRIEPDIPLGTRGTFAGTLYEVVGYLVRSDQTDIYEWREYLLYNPAQGFTWLVEVNGGWNFVKMIKDAPDTSGGGLVYKERSFRAFLTDSPIVQYVLGEFYWRVSVGEKVGAVDYVSPPYILSREMSRDENNWSFGVYMTPDQVTAAFGKVQLKLPPKLGVMANEPNPYEPFPFVTAGMVFGFLMFFIGALATPPGTGNNVFTGLLLVLAYPAWVVYMSSTFETQRWSESDFAPVTSGDDSEDDGS